MRYPIIKKFNEISVHETSIITTEILTIGERHFRCGTVLFIIGWKEINYIPYLIVSRGSWQGLVDLEYIDGKIKTLK